MNVNKLRRSYHSGKALHIDLRGLIIDRCLRYGGDQILVIFQFSLRHWAKSWAYLGIQLPKYGAIIALTTGEQVH
jgi:hypothetical protein